MSQSFSTFDSENTFSRNYKIYYMTTGIATIRPNLFHYSTIVCYSFWCYSTFIYIVCQKWQREFRFLVISMTFFGTMLWIYLPSFGHGRCYSVMNQKREKNGGGKKMFGSANEFEWNPLGHEQCNMWKHPFSNWMNSVTKTHKTKLP